MVGVRLRGLRWSTCLKSHLPSTPTCILERNSIRIAIMFLYVLIALGVLIEGIVCPPLFAVPIIAAIGEGMSD